MESEKILMRRTGAIGWVTVNNPERRNAISFDMYERLGLVMGEFEDDPAVRVIVVTGAGGKAFISGADISKFDQERASLAQVAAYRDNADRMYESFRQLSKPTIAMIRGWCIGGGVAVALNCDLRVCTEGSKFGNPSAKLGIGYTMKNIRIIVEIIGVAAAKEVLFTSRHYTAAEAHRIGLVHHVVADSDLEQFVESYAEGITRNAPLSLKQMKKVFEEIFKDPAKRNEDACDRLFNECYASNDYIEGRRAFMEKRPPNFQGS